MPDDQLRLLSLDGGGVRGLSSLYILRNLMEKIDPDAHELPKPCDYFDMIGGTSTGGLIAIMLGRLEMSVDECIEAYTSLSEEIFSKDSKSKLKFTFLGDIKSRFDAARLEKATMKILDKAGMNKDTLLSSPEAKCKVFVCAASQKNDTVVLRSYKSPRDNRRLGYVKIWEACRATSAAQGFFDPIAIPPGKGSELFTDGGIRVNNPVKELWGQACDLWAVDSATSQDVQLRSKLSCLVSIGTGRPDLTSYSTSLKGVVKVLTKIATDTEAVAESLAKEKPELSRDGQYFRFNVERGLKGIGLDECDKLSDITSATGSYIETQAVYSSLQSCAAKMSNRSKPLAIRPRKTHKPYRIPFKLDGVVYTDNFVTRTEYTKRIEDVLLDDSSDQCRIFVLHGMGGIGKTQLAMNFAYKYKNMFDSVFWLQAQTEDALRQSLVRSAKRIPRDQISEKSRRANPADASEQQEIIDEVLEWLGQEGNSNWLLVFDNIDLDPNSAEDRKRGAFKVADYLPAGQGSILITSRLETLSQIGGGRSREEVAVVGYELSKRIFEHWSGQTLDDDDDTRKLLGPERLSGLPLAVAQAAVYVKQNPGMSIAEYLRRFDSMWPQVMGCEDERPLHDYHGAVGVAWTLSMEQVREKSEDSCRLVSLWAFLDNPTRSRAGPYRLGFAKSAEKKAISTIVCEYSKVHRWAMHTQATEKRIESLKAALRLFADGLAPSRDDRFYNRKVTDRFRPHMLKCFSWVTIEIEPLIFQDPASLISILEALDMFNRYIPGLETTLLRRILHVDNTHYITDKIRCYASEILGSTLSADEPAAAEAAFRESFALALKTFGKSYRKKFAALMRLARFKIVAGDLAEAMTICDLILAEGFIVEHEDASPICTAHALIASIWKQREQPELSASHAEKALDLLAEHVPHDDGHRSWFQVQLCLANLTMILKKPRPERNHSLLQKTQDYLTEAVQTCSRQYSERDYLTQISIFLLAFVHLIADQLEEAGNIISLIPREDSMYPNVVNLFYRLLCYSYAQQGDEDSALVLTRKLRDTNEREGLAALDLVRTGSTSDEWSIVLQDTWQEVYGYLRTLTP
ncbi:hypothetical protein NLU13_2540 [Sarocladium strictum]|uniref:PNPLA domain-containing protein n=1 Tax=Sarocladium strictum TaxID=5046 RepID=A0AA39GLT3_SARSR|nr:hypothetical protein NLU13_2540 [Sarocladium strictum]